MRIKVSFWVEIDPDIWIADYSVKPDEVREDARKYIEDSVRAHLQDAGHPG